MFTSPPFYWGIWIYATFSPFENTAGFKSPSLFPFRVGTFRVDTDINPRIFLRGEWVLHLFDPRAEGTVPYDLDYIHHHPFLLLPEWVKEENTFQGAPSIFGTGFAGHTFHLDSLQGKESNPS